MRALEFYQLGGFGAQTNRWPYPWNERFLHDLPATVGSSNSPLWKDARINLVLGMKHDGSTYLLIPISELFVLLQHYHLPPPPNESRPFRSTQYTSISPITFASLKSLETKMKKMRPPTGKKKRLTEARDTSPANKSYVSADNFTHMWKRAAFEHARVVWRVLGKEIALQDWSMPACRWNLSANIMIFAWSEWQLPNSKKDAHRQLLDIAWSTPTPSREFGESTKITHLKFLESKLFVNEGSKPGVFRSGTTQEVSKSDASKLFHEAFSPARQQATSTPLLIVVQSADAALKVFDDLLGIDTLDWEVGVRSLLGYTDNENVKMENIKIEERSSPIRQSRSPSTSTDPRRRRNSRSASPPGRTNTMPLRARSPSRSSAAPVYIIDVGMLFTALKRQYFKKPPFTLSEICDDLEVKPGPKKGEWCAGNDVQFLQKAWRSMVAGPPIDERLELLLSAKTSVKPKLQQQQDDDDHDEEGRDLLDEAPAVGLFSTASKASKPSNLDYWDEIEDDDDE